MRTFACLTVLAVTAIAPAADWPQWLGPNRDSTTTEIVKPWREPPKTLWRVAVGPGHSSPVVAGNRAYLMDQVTGKDAERVRDWDARTGARSQLGDSELSRGPFSSPFGTGPRATPVVAGDTVYALGVTGDLYIRRSEIASVHDTVFNGLERYHAPNLKFGVSASPLVDGNNVIVLVGGKGAGIVALNRSVGELAWKSLDDPASYASPIVTEHGGKRQLIALTGAAVVSLDAASGELLWRYPFRDAINESSTTPLRVGDLIVASSVTLGSVGLKLGTKDGKPTVTEVWKNPALCCYFSTPVAVKDKYLYMVTGSLAAVLMHQPESALNCVEAATGKVLWTKPKVGKYHAALIRTGDDKLLMHSDSGELTMIDPDPKEYRELCQAKICGETWAHPALANGRLYVRDNKELICLQLNP
ncbi:MAG TPA: PQQ-binding-like beta-propeller repeat protein [Gemmataceae bacterium]|nr:PQQ-binding-like beta-propeller repeat protein [Gemmataceae bacterium]